MAAVRWRSLYTSVVGCRTINLRNFSSVNNCINCYNVVTVTIKSSPRLITSHFLSPNLLRSVCPQVNYEKFFCTVKKSAENKTSAFGTGFSGFDSSKSDNPNSEEDQEKARHASWRTIKLTLIAFGSSLGILGGYLFFTLGTPSIDEHGNPIEDEYSNLPTMSQYYKRAVSQLEFYTRMIKEPSRKKLLPDTLKPPFVQPPYTLVLELTDLLVHPEWTYNTGWRFKKRPGVDHFLDQVGPPLFEVVVYTAEQGMTAFPLLDSLDANNNIMYRLVRDSTDFVEGHHVKNLDCLNRDLARVIVVDWNPNSVKLHRANTFLMPRWQGNDNDTALYDLAAFLRTIAVNQVQDVREVLLYYSQFDNPIEAFKENQRKLMEQLEEKKQHEKQKSPPLTSRWASSSFLNKPT